MPAVSIKKNFPEIGEIEFKIASTRQELEGAFGLIYKEYSERGFILPKYYKSGLRITLHNILPDTVVFVALKDKEVVATNTIIPDSPLGLPLDMGYKKEADMLRKSGRKICEGGYLAIKSELFGRHHFSMFNFRKLEFLFTLFKLMFQYALLYKEFDDLCIVTNPQYMIFKFLPFEAMSGVKYYGYDRMSVKKKAALFKRLDLSSMRKYIDRPHKIIGKRYVLYKMFLGTRFSESVFKRKFTFNPQDLRYFFVEKSDILKKAAKQQRGHFRSSYGLKEKELGKILKDG